jgi:neutral ceramidase
MNSGDCSGNQTFSIGTGMHDITGPAAGRVMLGYVNFTEQFTNGIHMRLRSRAFVIESKCNGNRIAFVSADLGMIFGSVKRRVVKKLQEKYDQVYAEENVIISATHTHSGPGGFSHHLLYNAISLNFDEAYFEVIASGIFDSIVKAHENLTSGRIRIGVAELSGASKNRSLEAYHQNTDRQSYNCETDNEMTLLRFTADDPALGDIGVLNWYAVHGTSLSKHNRLISGDNKGLASYLFEKAHGVDYAAARTFVAAFAQSNEGDVSPNVLPDDQGGKDGRNKDDEFLSLQASAQAQCQTAQDIYNRASDILTGGVAYRHRYVDFARQKVAASWTDDAAEHETSASAIGVSKLAGAEDGRGPGLLLRFIPEGVSQRNFTLPRRALTAVARFVIVLLVKLSRFFWKKKARRRMAAGISLTTPRSTDQGAKPVLLATGSMKPDPWTQNVLPLQLATIGQLAIIAVPFECTTMAGRRIRAAVEKELEASGIRYYVIAGLANDYGGYVTTAEEYRAQHYEGASTEFGPWQLDAIREQTAALAEALRDGRQTPSDSQPSDPEAIFDLPDDLDPRNYDDAPDGGFGTVRKQPARRYQAGNTASASFWAAHPARDLRIQATFLEVQRQVNGKWQTVARDWDPETRFRWSRRRGFLFRPFSEATVEWHIPGAQAPGTYRIIHFGRAKLRSGELEPYTGISDSFDIVTIA